MRTKPLIRPCAYCWGDADMSWYPEQERAWVTCLNMDCSAYGGEKSTPEEAIKAWNAVTDAVKVRLSPHSEEYIKACKSE